MINKKDRTLELYKTSGALMRLFKSVASELIVNISAVLKAEDTDKLIKLIDKIESLSSTAENNMFKDYPGLNNEYIDVFYGSLKGKPKNKLDEEIIQKAKELSKQLFDNKN
ncbi:MAG: hypothetical protein ACI4RC_04545 [Oscillospiraceae bacterium]